jgi:hypothetical protein
MVRKGKNQSDEMEKYVRQRVRNPPRIRVKGNIGDSTILHGMEVTKSITSANDGTGQLVIPLIGGSFDGLETTLSPLQSVARLYNSFLFQACSIKYIPSVGLNTPGNVTICFLNNAESCYYALDAARTHNELKTLCLGQANSVSHPVWHEFSYPMKQAARRKRFDVNNTSAIADTNTVERDCQGVFVIIITGATASTAITTPRRESRILLEGLSTSFP